MEQGDYLGGSCNNLDDDNLDEMTWTRVVAWKWKVLSDPGYTLKLGPKGFANRSDVGLKRRSITDDDCIWPELLEGWHCMN